MMPIYDFKCDKCKGLKRDISLSIRHSLSDTPVCCGCHMNYYISSAPLVHWKDPVIEPFRSLATKDKPIISTTRQNREYMKRNDLIDANELGPPPTNSEQEAQVAEMKKTIDAITPSGQLADEMKKRGMLDVVS